MHESIRELLKSSHLSAGNIDYIEGLYESWMESPTSV
ncbi:MAG: 2-oxoglutarate dehydrogenase E1 subunit family protein, partial [Pseudohongiellaceae bacterium]